MSETLSKKLNLKINGFSVSLNSELNKEDLLSSGFKPLDFLGKLAIKPNKEEEVFFSQNCKLTYLDEHADNVVCPSLDPESGADMMYGTTCYLTFKNNMLTKGIFQIIQNKMFAEVILHKIEEKVIERIGSPSILFEEDFLKGWEEDGERMIMEFPQGVHGYIHLLMNDNN